MEWKWWMKLKSFNRSLPTLQAKKEAKWVQNGPQWKKNLPNNRMRRMKLINLPFIDHINKNLFNKEIEYVNKNYFFVSLKLL